MLNIVRNDNIKNYLKPIVEKGHSVWSNACGWFMGLNRKDIYDSDSYRAAMDSKKWTIKEAVEQYVFEGETFSEIDAYPWPYNTACSFSK